MKSLFIKTIFLLFLSINNIYAEPYQKEVWRLLDKAHKNLLTKPEQSVVYSLDAFNILKQTTDSSLIVSTLSLCGYAYMLQGSFDLSINCYYDALFYCPFKDASSKAGIKVQLGTLYGSLKDFSKAIELINKATSTYKVLKDSSGVANAYNARGLIHVYMSENNVADKFFIDALRINKALKSEKNIAANINNMCLYEGNTEEKIKLLKEAIDINKRLNSIWSLAENYNNMGMQLFHAGRYDQAVVALKEAAIQAEEINAQELICDNYEYFAKVYSAKGDFEKAYKYLLDYEAKRTQLLQERRLSSIERKVANQKMQDQEKRTEIQKQQHQIEILKLNIFIVVALSICVFLLIFFLIKQFKRKKNLQIAEAHAELLAKDKIITDLKLQRQAVELEAQSKKLKTTQSELTNFVLFINCRNDLLDKIREMIKGAYRMEYTQMLAQLKKISTFILQFKNMEEENSNLTKEVDEQNQEFLNRLNEKHPGLTPREKELAIFLRINLSTKEISLLTGTSIKAIGMSRYRLRKTLGIDSKEDITEYFRNI